ncbi:UDP-glycosyltransferase UGT5-like [Bacillus rossius redtenbacheri]|uniref:UDP-glycosyltransferase UGT5-like n=1 Tax=Bacillus rossius redtenbacheri TaxID=93214 RepID=UPI002FDEA36E
MRLCLVLAAMTAVAAMAGCRAAPSYQVLAVLPHFGRSHFDVFEPYLRHLARRGHQVTVLGRFPLAHPVANYTDLALQPRASREVFSLADLEGSWALGDSLVLARQGLDACEEVLSSEPARELLLSGRTFHLVVHELFDTDCFLGFAHAFRAPHLAVSSSRLMPWGGARFGNPDPAPLPGRTLGERLVDFLELAAHKSLHRRAGLARRTSLVLVNTHFSLNGARASQPAVVEVGGIHLRPPSPLPRDLDELLSGNRHGAVYFSMGSMIRADTFPPDKTRALLDAFSALPQTVLCKWRGDPPLGAPPNVHFRDWLPQQDVLCHGNVVAFVSHGGLLGTIEAAHCGVPMVVVPMYGDQPANARDVVARGMAVRLGYRDITAASVLRALRAVINDTRYGESARRVSRAFRDRPMSPADTAVYWTEYVARHGGAPHLRSAAVDLAWYQYLLLDVAGALAAAVAAAGWLVRLAVARLLSACRLRKLKAS